MPGQGEQHIGMGEKLKTHRASMEIYENASSILNYDVWDLCQSGPKSKLDQTVYSHTALFVNTMAAMEKLKSEVEEFDERLTEVAGFGVGEFAALVLAGVLKFEDGNLLSVWFQSAVFSFETCRHSSASDQRMQPTRLLFYIRR